MTYAEFLSKQFPQKSVFDRPQFDFLTNLIKWFALHVAYIPFRLGISANFLDVAGLFFSLGGFILLGTAVSGNQKLPLIGIVMIYLHVLLDFVDGPIAKAGGKCSPLGYLLDEIGCHIDRFAMFITLGIFAQSTFIILMNVFTAGTIELLVQKSKEYMPQTGVPGFFRRIYINKYSFLSMRFTLVLIPFVLIPGILKILNLGTISFVLSLFYAVAMTGWLLLCLPRYEAKE